MNKLPIVLLLLIFVSCSGERTHEIVPDIDYLRDIAYEYATRYRIMVDSGSTEMERENYLLDVNSRISAISEDVGGEYAAIFRQAFADSAFTTLKSNAQRLKTNN